MRKWSEAWTFIGFQFYGLQSEKASMTSEEFLLTWSTYRDQVNYWVLAGCSPEPRLANNNIPLMDLRVLPCENFTQPSPALISVNPLRIQTFMETAFLELIRLWCTGAFKKLVITTFRLKFVVFKTLVCLFSISTFLISLWGLSAASRHVVTHAQL